MIRVITKIYPIKSQFCLEWSDHSQNPAHAILICGSLECLLNQEWLLDRMIRVWFQKVFRRTFSRSERYSNKTAWQISPRSNSSIQVCFLLFVIGPSIDERLWGHVNCTHTHSLDSLLRNDFICKARFSNRQLQNRLGFRGLTGSDPTG